MQQSDALHLVEWLATSYITFVDFEKAFDSVHQEILWYMMLSLWNTTMVYILYEDSACAVLDEGEE